MNPERRLSKGERIHNRREKAAHRNDDVQRRINEQNSQIATKKARLEAEEAERAKQKNQEETRRAQIRRQVIDARFHNQYLSYGRVQSLDDTEPLTILEYAELGVELTWIKFKLGAFGREKHADELGSFLLRLPREIQNSLEASVRMGKDGKPVSKMIDIRDKVLTPEDLKRYTGKIN